MTCLFGFSDDAVSLWVCYAYYEGLCFAIIVTSVLSVRVGF